jgi:hypothetical protein
MQKADPSEKAHPARKADADPRDGRDESDDERSDRNWADILQELRVTQTGTQIISGFLLTLVFQQRFTQLTGGQIALYVGLVIVAAATTALGLAPVALHRTLFAQHQKETMVRIGARLLRAVLVLVAALTGGVVLLIVSVAVDWPVAWVSASAICLLLIVLLVILPAVGRRSRLRRADPGN